MFLSRLIRFWILAPLMMVFFLSCNSSNDREVLYKVEDLNGLIIGVLEHSVSEEDFDTRFPDSKDIQFKSSSEFLLSISIGKCDAGIAQAEEGRALLYNNLDFDVLSSDTADSDSVVFIVHRRNLPGGLVQNNRETFFNSPLKTIDRSLDRIGRSIIYNNYWRLLLRGLIVTVTIFVFGIILAFALAILMTWMNMQQGLGYISKPISYFIKTIHDVPSVVLIFFFYYVIFAHIQVHGIIVCIIALGIYSSGSLMNIFQVHLNQVSKAQHNAAHTLGLYGWKKYKYVIMPQAVKPMLPLLAAESKVLLRATSYAGYISQFDLVKVTEVIRNQTYDVLVPLIFVSIVFLVLSRFIVDILSYIYKRAFSYDKDK